MKKVLFVCVENSCRSQMAEALAKMSGQDTVEAYSSGSNPSGVVNPNAIASMQELGYDLSTHVSKALHKVPDIEYDLLVTMGCGDVCPSVNARQRVDWQIPDPKHMDKEAFAKIRDLLAEKVGKLIESP